MIKSKRLISVVLTVLMMLSLMSGIIVNAADFTEIKGAVSYDEFYNGSIDVINNPGYGIATPAGFVVISNDWNSAEDNSRVYYTVAGSTYYAIKGHNAFGGNDITSAIALSEAKTVIKFAPGTYSSDVTVSKPMTFIGAKAGVNPNVITDDGPWTLNTERSTSATTETVITGTWTWTLTANEVTLDGFYVTSGGNFYAGVSGRPLHGLYVYNCYFNSTSTYGVNWNVGSNQGIWIENNRFTNSTNGMLGGACQDVHVDNNYFEGITNNPLLLTSTAYSTAGAVTSFSGNYVYRCGTTHHRYDTTNYGINADRIIYDGNVFDSPTGDSCILYTLYTDMMQLDSATAIQNNTFKNVGSNCTPIKLTMAESSSGNTLYYKVNINYNKFYMSNPIINASYTGSLDLTYNYYEGGFRYDDRVFVSDTVDVIVSPYYIDEDMTTIEGASRILSTTIPGATLDNSKFTLTFDVEDSVEVVDFTDTLEIEGSRWELYEDFMLLSPVSQNQLYLTGEITKAYIVVYSNDGTSSSKYLVNVNHPLTTKNRKEIKAIINGRTDEPLAFTQSGNTITANLADADIYMPFTIKPSVGATVAVYTDSKATKPYESDDNFIPAGTTTLYIKVTAANGESTIYTLRLIRNASSEYDARIVGIKAPTENMQLFNNDRKRIVYRPTDLVKDVEFDFYVTNGASYKIYKNYSNGKYSNLLSDSKNVKSISISDGRNEFYVEVTSQSGLKTHYTLVVYNFTRSDENEITGINGIDNYTINGNNINIEVPTITTIVNTLFNANVFADIRVYADKDMTFELTPTVTTTIVDGREAELRTFPLNCTATTTKFYVRVTSETDKSRDYIVTISKPTTEISFEDINNHWAEQAIQNVANAGIISGTLEGEKYYYNPNNNATRQEIAVLIIRLLGIEPEAFKAVNLSNIFEDASSVGDWSYNYVRAVYTLNIMVGDNGEFHPKDNITRQEFFVTVANVLKLDTNAAANYSLSKFSDASSVASWALPYTKAVVKEGIIVGNDGKLEPKSHISRAEIAVILDKMMPMV